MCRGTLPSNSVLDRMRHETCSFPRCDFFFTGKIYGVVCRELGRMVALCPSSTLTFLSSERSEQGVLIEQEQVVRQVWKSLQPNSSSFRAAKWADLLRWSGGCEVDKQQSLLCLLLEKKAVKIPKAAEEAKWKVLFSLPNPYHALFPIHIKGKMTWIY